ncbi:MAG: formate dehydrogenase accessory sulfurtransferase FdhD [Chloroflexi bacterium]|nr:formate dehydrogenase accessory sulfurtransferase FdhD [Chloroflexota bacterium]MCI0579249.1 formate dehydrogenase accessory sulfurtransferase FdhD [Chloroflexota bacterium]MCI0647106.1 formate dehydrogenase accessory sulfurtransferase FdhD [Chloroflexota bacterium]MCI0725880.1 formate dehydrogenase accessory sulfurtransferase FdhD [Chloroflexota bacterium]
MTTSRLDEEQSTLKEPGNGVGVRPVHYISVGAGSPQDIDGEIVDEAQVCIAVNGRELATFMCSPNNLDWMALGFLANEGLIAGLDDVRSLHISAGDTCVDVWLHDLDVELPTRPIITAGCGGGVTFDDLSQRHEPLHSQLQTSPTELASLMRQVHLGAELYQRARGIHTAALAGPGQILLQVEDLGRHNCLDKLRGGALLAGLETRDRILLSSGRISSEMINKARRLETPIVCSRTSPTSLSVALAEAWNMTVVAYIRQDRMRIYTHPERVEIVTRTKD